MDEIDWKAPQADKGVLVSPGIAQLISGAQANHVALTQSNIMVQRRPLRHWRQRMRECLGQTASDQLLFCSGHQAELYHPGVWIKLALIHELSLKVAGSALHIAVDSDEPKHLQLRWPGGGVTLTDANGAASWAARLASPTTEHLHSVSVELQTASRDWDFEPIAPEFLRLLKAENHRNLPAAIAYAMQKLDRTLGLSYHLNMTEPIWSAEPYLAFVLHLLSHADEFANHYNHALAEYRQEQGIRSPGRPMPDLRCDANEIEMPFWLDELTTGRRTRLSVAKRQGSFRLMHGDADIELHSALPTNALAGFCASQNIRLAPRALTLTMFIRLIVCDQWIHGIGGARYDQVTDRIIYNFFQKKPPTFGVATATLYFPSAHSRQRTDLAALKHLGHQLKHRSLGRTKDAYLKEISAAPRRSARRIELFAEMHRAMDQTESAALAEWNGQWHHALREFEKDRLVFDRELFYALQSRTRLLELKNSLA
ncbi:MAG TPA: hypothetical protein VG722_02310 [Tepidisphaeraceae bacterium]|nr:hypothetical protein [Tepidisphaeraceae bacterium]